MKNSVGKKLYGGFFAVLILMLLLGYSGISKLGALNKSSDIIALDKVPALNLAQEMKYILSENFGVISEHIISPNDEVMLSKEEKYKVNKEKLDKLFLDYDKTVSSDKERTIFNKLENELVAYDEFVLKVFDLSANNKDDKAVVEVGKYQDNITTMKSEIDELVQINLEYANKASSQTTSLYKSGFVQSMIFIIIALVAGILIAYFITRSITKPLVSARNTLSRISDGDLTMEPLQVHNKDEIGSLIQSLNRMVLDLNSTISNTSESAIQVASSSEQLSASAEESTQSTEQLLHLAHTNTEESEVQLEKINSVSSSLEKMVKQVGIINSSSSLMNQSVQTTNEFVQDGMQSIDIVVSRIHDIKLSFEDVDSAIKALEELSNRIGKILTLITDISNQTNLLALNAAIEASRAGEHGKGFAVVADEVRKLAEESKQSADQIAAMISDIQTETKQAVSSIDEGNTRVQEGINSTEAAKQSFGHIEQSMSDASNKVTDVSISVKDIENISRNISEAIENVRHIAVKSVSSNQESSHATEEQVATMQEVSSSAQSLSMLAEDMQMAISKFKLKN